MKFLTPKIKQFLSLLLKLIVVGLAFYFIQSQLAEKIIVTQLGKTLTDYRHESVIQSALAFRKCVFDSMRDLIRDDDFVFQTMEG